MTNEDYKKIEDLKRTIEIVERKIQTINNVLREDSIRLILEGDTNLLDDFESHVNQRLVIDDDKATSFIRYIIDQYKLDLERLNKIFKQIQIII